MEEIMRSTILINIFLLSCSATYGQKLDSSVNRKDDLKQFTINGKKVEEKYFNHFLSKLKEMKNTWFCAETNTGGITGSEVKDKKGNIYIYRFESITGQNISSLIRKKHN